MWYKLENGACAFADITGCAFLHLFRLQVPVDLVIDHSVQVDVARSENAVQANMELEFHRNKERFGFLKWGSTAFRNMLVVPPGSGIVHQVYQETIILIFFSNISPLLYNHSKH